MSVSPKEFLDSAYEYAETNKEVNKRNAISRSYYASYHVAKSIFPLKRDFISSNDKAGVHSKYIEFLSSCDAGSKQRIIGLLLKKLLVRRRVADYDLDELLKSDDLALQLATSTKIFNLLEPE